MSNVILELNNIAMHFGGLKAVDEVNFSVKEGEIMSLIGPNGAGKTTIFNVITGVYTPTFGTVSFKGETLEGKKPFEITEAGIARTFQNIRLFKQHTVRENIALAMHCRRKVSLADAVFRTPHFKRERAQTILHAEEFLDMVDLLGAKDDLAENLPYGKQRELEIVRALATGAEILLLDEPAAGMNPQETDELMDFIRRIRTELKKTVFLIEHDMKLVMGISDRIVVLDHGRKIAEGLPQEIRDNLKVIEAYLGKEVAEHA